MNKVQLIGNLGKKRKDEIIKEAEFYKELNETTK